VRIDVVYVHEETGVRDIRGLRRFQSMFRHLTMQPHGRVTRADLAVDGLAVGVPVHTPAVEAEGLDQKLVSSGDVLIGQNRNDSLEIGHDVHPLMSA
jgi:hypothetical protein